jgi:AraC-like DNA-binding protein
MKNIIKQTKIIAVFFILFGIMSCEDDFLSPVPSSVITEAGFYATEAQVQSAVVNMYDGIQGINDTRSDSNHAIQIEYYVTEMRSDNTRSKSGEGDAGEFDLFTLRSTNGFVADYYRSFYNVIFRANTVLENLEAVSDAKKAKIEAEAKFVRAYSYFNMVRLFGEIPLIDKVIAPSDKETQFMRVATDKIYELIVSDFDFAVKNLENGTKRTASKAAAQGLLAKVYLTQGEYTKAQLLVEEVMELNYVIEPNFNDVFYDETNKEVIFSIGFETSSALDSQNFSAEFLNGVGRTVGVNYVTADAVAALEVLGGDRTIVSYRNDRIQTTQNQVAKFLPDGRDGGANGKTFIGSDPRLAGNDWIVLRYSDILLMHVEAILGTSDETSVSAAIASFQQIRNRAGLATPVTNITKQELLDERRVELAFENHRLFDLIRFGKAQEVLSTFSAATGGSFSSTDLLLPIPQYEINLSNGLLSQNAGYN